MKNCKKIHKTYNFYGKVFQADNDGESNSHKWTELDGQFNEYRAWKSGRIKLYAHRSKVLLEVSKIPDLDPDE